MKDNFNREINYLRISVTDRCNLRCVYCAPFKDIGCADVLSYEEIIEIAKAAKELGFKKIRLTGGEPLVRKNFVYLVEEIGKLGFETAVTTNGILLPKYAANLKRAGVSRVNISLDTLKPERFKKITGGDLKGVLRGIDASKEAGLYVKLNAVLIKSFNGDEILDFIELTRRDKIEVRFLEWMPINVNQDSWNEGYMDVSAALEAAPDLIKIKDEGVARNYKLPDGKGKVGLISAVSNHFCADCNRLRLTSDGKLAPCLHSNFEISVKGLRGEELKSAIRRAVLAKPSSHGGLKTRASGSDRIMRQIGG
jgi:cyclic pyranopterin phosphate synthase